ncbi:hypothetical protein [Thermoactinomyces mirandus]|uniref:hypothetical protein n=1 Tax=Thermoactinomyces mirandus TaxID=2756294 RepID=UPI0015EF0E12|nr:hypothetical protein [Thermoactinomyces mirandus]
MKKELLEQFPENERNLIKKHLKSGNHKNRRFSFDRTCEELKAALNQPGPLRAPGLLFLRKGEV